MTTRLLAKYLLTNLPRSPDDGGGAAPATGSESSPTPSPAAPTSPSASSPSSPTSADGSTRVEGETRNEPPSGAFDTMGATDDLDFIELPADTGLSGTSTTQAPSGGDQSTTAKDLAAAPAQTPPAAPTTDPTTQPTSSTAPQATPAAVAPAAAAPSSPAPTGPEAVLQGLENPEAQDALRGFLAQDMFKLSDAEKLALDTDAVGAIPQVMARVHLEGVKNTLKLLSTLVPQMVEQGVKKSQESTKRSTEALSDFYKQWPTLKNGEHDSLVGQFSRVFRASNPAATRAEAIKFVGAAIHAHLGIAPGAATNGATSAPRAAPPFAPARPGARQVVSEQVLDTPFGGLGRDFDSD